MIKIGIQGGPGSFNEEACHHYTRKNHIKDFELKYLYTTENVLKALNNDEVDFGQFAIHNSIGGIVRESIEALSKYNCEIIEEFEILINHCLLAFPGIGLGKIRTIMSHPQALAQCQSTLREKYPLLKQVSGEGNMIDQATAAKALSEGKLSKDIAVIASGVCAKLYDLTILDIGLQDRKDNLTSFLWVLKRK